MVLKFERERNQWTLDSRMLYQLNALLSLWFYSFMFEDEPGVGHDNVKSNISTFLDYSFKKRISEDYFSIVGSGDEKDRLACLGVAHQNIVELRDEYESSPAMPRDYVAVFTDFDVIDKVAPDFVRRNHCFGQSLPHQGPVYAYKHASSPGTSPVTQSRNDITPKM